MLPDRIERITGPLAFFLAWPGIIAMIAQSLPRIPPPGRLSISIVCVVVIAIHIAVCVWRDWYVPPSKQEGDDES